MINIKTPVDVMAYNDKANRLCGETPREAK